MFSSNSTTRCLMGVVVRPTPQWAAVNVAADWFALAQPASVKPTTAAADTAATAPRDQLGRRGLVDSRDTCPPRCGTSFCSGLPGWLSRAVVQPSIDRPKWSD